MTSLDRLRSLPSPLGRAFFAIVSAALAALCLTTAAPAQTQPTSDRETSVGGPIRLRQPQAQDQTAPPDDSRASRRDPAIAPGRSASREASPDDAAAEQIGASFGQLPNESEFERYARLPRFGVDLVTSLAFGKADFTPIVPPDYVIQTGDEVTVTIWGSVDADLRLIVDRSGRISIPRVGPVMVAGTRLADLPQTLTRRASQVFKNFELSASLGRLRGVRVYVTGFVQRPGAYVVSSLSTAINAVMQAGGPGDAGSFRQIELRRDGKTIARLDLYDTLLRGDRGSDTVLQPDDVVHVVAVGPRVAVRGSVNRQAIYEFKPGETLADLLRMAGGFNAVADRTRISMERLDERHAQRVIDMPLPGSESAPLADGDVVRAYSAINALPSIVGQNRRVKVDGEVARPGEYLMPPGSTISDVLRKAGGVTPAAFLYGALFARESVRVAQQANYEKALRDFETDVVRTNSTMRVSAPEEAAAAKTATESSQRLIAQLRALKPTGRLTFQLSPDTKELPDLMLEDGDSLFVPARPDTVGVFGSVFNAGSFVYAPDHTVGDYLQLAGGPTRGADRSSVFVVRANGTVESSLERGGNGWFSRGNLIADLRALPGDTIFVPEELNKINWLSATKDWTQIFFNFGLGFAGLKTALGW